MNSSPRNDTADQEQQKKNVVDFLLGDGGNEKLARMIEERGTLYGPIDFELQKLRRLCGPEDTMKWREPLDEWEGQISHMIASMESGWEAPPLIAWLLRGTYELADGAHRFEALKRLGRTSYPTIVWCSDEEARKQFLKEYGE